MEYGSPTVKKTEDFASVIRSTFATLLSLHSQWLNLTSVASLAANQMVNNIIKLKYASVRQLEASNSWGVLSDDEETKRNVILKLEIQIQGHARSLEASFEDLCKKYCKAKCGVDQLENRYWGKKSEIDEKEPVLCTATPSTWINWANQLLSMFTQDLVLKRTLIIEIGRISGEKRDIFLLYLNAWSSSPLLDFDLVSYISEMANTELNLNSDLTTPSKSNSLSTPDISPLKSSSKSPSSASKTRSSKSSRPGKSPSIRSKTSQSLINTMIVSKEMRNILFLPLLLYVLLYIFLLLVHTDHFSCDFMGNIPIKCNRRTKSPLFDDNFLLSLLTYNDFISR